MVKRVKNVIDAKGDYVAVRVILPKNTYKALKIKCTMLDISTKEGIIDLVDKWVMDVKRDLIDTKPNR